jgi:hypothetical protein
MSNGCKALDCKVDAGSTLMYWAIHQLGFVCKVKQEWHMLNIRSLIASVLVLMLTIRCFACPFCGALSGTITDEISEAKVAVVAKCTAFQEAKDQDSLAIATFDCVTFFKGEEYVETKQGILVACLDRVAVGDTCLLLAYDCEPLEFGMPIKLSVTAQEYLAKLSSLPKAGRERLAYFLKYIDQADTIVSDDAYNEFARASFEDVQQIGPVLDREHVIEKLLDPKTSLQLRRLYWTFLSICGTSEDRSIYHRVWKESQKDDQFNPGLDAAISCLLILCRDEGLKEISETILENPKAEFGDVYSAILALRVHVQDLHVLPKEQLLAAVRKLLQRSDVADQVIADLARWEDWSVVTQLVDLFKQSEATNSRLRLPIVQYLLACPKPEAKEAIAELESFDPETVRKARTFFGNAPPPVPPK